MVDSDHDWKSYEPKNVHVPKYGGSDRLLADVPVACDRLGCEGHRPSSIILEVERHQLEEARVAARASLFPGNKKARKNPMAKFVRSHSGFPCQEMPTATLGRDREATWDQSQNEYGTAANQFRRRRRRGGKSLHRRERVPADQHSEEFRIVTSLLATPCLCASSGFPKSTPIFSAYPPLGWCQERDGAARKTTRPTI